MKVLCVVQARFASARLPGKALYPLGDMPMLAYLLRRMATVSDAEHPLCLATTQRPDDDILAAWAGALGIPVVRGAQDDVLQRYLACLDAFGADACIRVTGDNPLTSRTMVRGVREALCQGYDYVDGYSDCVTGTGVDGFGADLLRRLDAMDLAPGEREHINKRVIDHPAEFSVHRVAAPEALRRRDVSLTVDTIEEFVRVRDMVARVSRPVEATGAADVIATA